MITRELTLETVNALLEGAKVVGSYSPLAHGYDLGQQTPTAETKEYFFDEETNLALILTGFHAVDYYTVKLDDDYIGNIRANHFMIEVGWSEEGMSQEHESIILVTGNHKGMRLTDIYVTAKGQITEQPKY